MSAMRIAFLVLAAALAQEPGKQPVAWPLKKGEKVRYEFDHTIVQGWRDHTTELKLTLTVAIEVTDVGADGTQKAGLTFERFVYSKVSQGDSEAYDSGKDKEPPKSSTPQVLSKCVGKTIPFRIGAAG